MRTTQAPTSRLTPGNDDHLAPDTAFVPLESGGKYVGLHPRTLRRAISSGELKGYKFGKAIRVRLTDLDAWAETKSMPSAGSGAGLPTRAR